MQSTIYSHNSKSLIIKAVSVLVVVLMACSLLIASPHSADAANIVKGDTKQNVITVQTKLKQWGYYGGAVDGIFGSGTRNAVLSFQRRNGLAADGIVGARTEAAMGVNLSRSSGSTGSTASKRNIIKGDTATNIRAVQTKLKQWGYYGGAVDGIFGSGTRNAVLSFQRRNGLAADGIVGARTEAAMGLNLSGGSTSSVPTSTSNDTYLLARCIYAEARGEPYTGMVAVGAVVLNRVRSPKFPNTISGVIYQPRAFTAVDDGQINLTPDQNAMKAAQDALNGWDPTNGCLYYYNPATATSPWIWSLTVNLKIGKHSFAKG